MSSQWTGMMQSGGNVRSGEFSIALFSFGFKHGPADADLVWDVRFLPNPYWDLSLRERSGLDDEVAAYVLENRVAREFLALSEPWLSFVCAQHSQGKRSTLRVAIGCTGGRHRSVAVTEYLKNLLDRWGYRVHAFHRDLEKE